MYQPSSGTGIWSDAKDPSPKHKNLRHRIDEVSSSEVVISGEFSKFSIPVVSLACLW